MLTETKIGRGIACMKNKEKIDSLVALQQDVCNMWNIDNQDIKGVGRYCAD